MAPFTITRHNPNYCLPSQNPIHMVHERIECAVIGVVLVAQWRDSTDGSSVYKTQPKLLFTVTQSNTYGAGEVVIPCVLLCDFDYQLPKITECHRAFVWRLDEKWLSWWGQESIILRTTISIHNHVQSSTWNPASSPSLNPIILLMTAIVILIPSWQLHG